MLTARCSSHQFLNLEKLLLIWARLEPRDFPGSKFRGIPGGIKSWKEPQQIYRILGQKTDSAPRRYTIQGTEEKADMTT